MTSLVVQKYGGSSVSSDKRILEVADHIAHTVKAGNQVVVVVSARGSSTDERIDLANKVSKKPSLREMDMLLTTGERVSMALLSIALNGKGVETVSFTGSQAGIKTDSNHGRAKIMAITPHRVEEALSSGKVVIVAGFQGVSDFNEITTLGRGGSDTTAVALAAGLNADVCEIYTDVSGVDPRIALKAKKLSEVSFDEMLEIAATGGRVLALRAVEFAKNHGVSLHVRSSFTWEQGTWIKEENTMEAAVVSAITHDTNEIKVTVVGLADKPGSSAELFSKLAEIGIDVDMIVQNISKDGVADISFTIKREDKELFDLSVDSIKESLNLNEVLINEEIGRISLVGVGMKSNPGVAAQMFRVLADESINIEMISTSAIRISCVINEDQVEQAVQSLHSSFDLDGG